jgi:hypothetical protein
MVGTGGGAEAAVRRWVEAGGGRLVLDGGLATELEANGADLNDPLWSAKCLLGAPHLIRKASTSPQQLCPCLISFHFTIALFLVPFFPADSIYLLPRFDLRSTECVGQGTAGSSQGI